MICTVRVSVLDVGENDMYGAHVCIGCGREKLLRGLVLIGSGHMLWGET
jgi:hypothetical protein